jgi:hypothetical protein
MRNTMRIALPVGVALGLLLAAPAMAIDTVRLPPKAVDFSFEGPFGTYDRGALQRGFQVYKEVCAACHAANHLSFHNLDEKGGPEFTEAQAKALAAAVKVPAEPSTTSARRSCSQWFSERKKAAESPLRADWITDWYSRSASAVRVSRARRAVSRGREFHRITPASTAHANPGNRSSPRNQGWVTCGARMIWRVPSRSVGGRNSVD